MCGIIGMVSKNKNVIKKIINSLEQLEYRGYDSAGITILENNNFTTIKSVGKINNLKNKISDNLESNIAIAHTRWATHGNVTEANAHPHTSCMNDITIVHNGIIENYTELKEFLIKNGYTFKSETDSEVICNLISYNLSKVKDIQEAFFMSVKELNGSYGIVMIYNKNADKIFIAKNGSPLVLGTAIDENLVASSIVAFSNITNKIIQLSDGEFATITSNEIKIFDKNRNKINKNIEEVKISDLNSDKGNFEHFMLKEIYEQPEVLKRTIQEYINIENKEIIFPKFNFNLQNIDFLTIVACGTSYHAGCIAKYFIEELTGIFVNVDIASEFRYRSTPLKEGGLSLFISQSGETADTLAALKYCKNKNQKVISIVNVVQSAIASLSDGILKTVAGVEIGVASTKAFTAQLSILYLLALEIAKENSKLSINLYHEKVEEFINSVRVLEESLKKEYIKEIKEITKELSKTKHIIYIGRDIYFPMALEGALKIKEISYIPTQGIASGELKHGPIALIDKDTFIIVLNNSNLLFNKNISSIEEIVARNGKVVLICDDKNLDKIKDKIYKFIKTSDTNNKFEILLASIIPIQLLAYYTSLEKGFDVDKPRNLAKSVTVE